jgi:hypothetical protein
MKSLTAAIARFCATVMRRRREKPGVPQVRILRKYSGDEKAQLGEQWLGVFGRYAEPRTLGWHIFGTVSFPSLSREAALEAYAQHLAPEYVVLPIRPWIGDAFVTDVRPAPETGRWDYFVFPPNLAWTMAFTHHDFDAGPSGPYFARHPDYERLNEENRVGLEKLRPR